MNKDLKYILFFFLDFSEISCLSYGMIKPKKKPTKKDLVYNIALNKRMIIELNQQIGILESVINKYIEMKKDTTKFNKYLQDQFDKEADEKTNNSEETT